MDREASGPARGSVVTRTLRGVEVLLLCSLLGLAALWALDRSRGLDFAPIHVEICQGNRCDPPPEVYSDRAWSRVSDAVDQIGLVVFSDDNLCRFAAEILDSRATEQSAELALNYLEDRGVLRVARVGDGQAIISPGQNNDDVWDIVRDAVRWQPSRGCYPIRYAPIFWPIWTGWMLLANLRLIRFRPRT